MVIGVDFDNTIADYDELMHKIALEEGFIEASISADKQKIRDAIRSLNDGEIKWQKLQAKAYGTLMAQAKLIEGVSKFFSHCHKQGIEVFIVSHKTQFAAQDQEGVDLHQASLSWMRQKNFFKSEHDGLSLREDRVFFEPTRQKKIERISALGCTHFIDDLGETFLETSFPQGVQKILYAPHVLSKAHEGVVVMSSWGKIYERFFTNIRE